MLVYDVIKMARYYLSYSLLGRFLYFNNQGVKQVAKMASTLQVQL